MYNTASHTPGPGMTPGGWSAPTPGIDVYSNSLSAPTPGAALDVWSPGGGSGGDDEELGK